MIGLSLGAVLAASPETSLRFFLDQNFVGDAERDGREGPGFGCRGEPAQHRGIFDPDLPVTPRYELRSGLTESAPDYTIGVALPILFDLPIR